MAINAITKNIENLRVVQTVVSDLQIEQITTKLPVLSGASIGQHVRHILEFYTCLLKCDSVTGVCYDKRERNIDLESNKGFIRETIDDIIRQLNLIEANRELILEISLSEDWDSVEYIPSSLFRELAYCLEHTIHHLATIKIALMQLAPEYIIPQNFGVAYATIQAEKKCVR